MHSLSGVNQETIPLRMTGKITFPKLPTVTIDTDTFAIDHNISSQ